MRRLRSLLVLSLCASVLACPKPIAKAKSVVIEDLPTDPTEQAKKTLDALYRAVENLDPDKLEALLTPDAVVFGIGPNDFYTDKSALMEAVRQEFVPYQLRGDKVKLYWSRPRVALDDSGRGGWLHDLPRFERIRDNGKSQFWSVRLTAHLVKDGSVSYAIDALHLSLGFPDAQLYAPKADRKLVPPIDPGVSRGKDSDELIGLSKRMLEDIEVKVNHTSDLEEVALIGTDVADVFEGGTSFKGLVRPKLAELKKNNSFTYKIEGGPRSKLAPGGMSGYVAANVVLSIVQGKSVQKLPAFRALWIFSREKDVWNLVSDHQSLGLKMEQREPTAREDLPKLEDQKLTWSKKAPMAVPDGGFPTPGRSTPIKSARMDVAVSHYDAGALDAGAPDAGPQPPMKAFE